MTAPTKPPKSARWTQFNGFVDVTLRTLTPSEVRVWLVPFRDTKRDGTTRTGQADIAARTGLSDWMVRYGLNGLIQKGLAKVIRRGSIRSGVSV